MKNTLIEEIEMTNEIEGVSSTRQEIENAVTYEANLNNKNLKIRFAGIVSKYGKIIDNQKIDLNTCKGIRTLYDEFVLDEIDEKDYPDGDIFRKEIVTVTSATQKVLHKGSYPERKIIENLEAGLKFLNDDTDKVTKIIKIAIIHYYFGYMHPFYDGNGRMGRFISSYLLSEELELFAGLRLSYSIKKKMNQNYNSFMHCNDPRNKRDVTSFIYTFLDFLISSYKELSLQVEDIEQKLVFYQRVLDGLKLGNKKEKCCLS